MKWMILETKLIAKPQLRLIQLIVMANMCIVNGRPQIQTRIQLNVLNLIELQISFYFFFALIKFL